jgi:transposase
MPQMTLLTGPERRRRWNDEDRCRILAAAFSPGAVVADVARRFDVATSLIYKWRRAYLAPSGFAPAVVVDTPALSAPEPTIPEPMIPEPQGPSILVELSNGTRVSVSATAPASLVTAALRVLR